MASITAAHVFFAEGPLVSEGEGPSVGFPFWFPLGQRLPFFRPGRVIPLATFAEIKQLIRERSAQALDVRDPEEVSAGKGGTAAAGRESHEGVPSFRGTPAKIKMALFFPFRFPFDSCQKGVLFFTRKSGLFRADPPKCDFPFGFPVKPTKTGHPPKQRHSTGGLKGKAGSPCQAFLTFLLFCGFGGVPLASLLTNKHFLHSLGQLQISQMQAEVLLPGSLWFIWEGHGGLKIPRNPLGVNLDVDEDRDPPRE